MIEKGAMRVGMRLESGGDRETPAWSSRVVGGRVTLLGGAGVIIKFGLLAPGRQAARQIKLAQGKFNGRR